MNTSLVKKEWEDKRIYVLIIINFPFIVLIIHLKIPAIHPWFDVWFGIEFRCQKDVVSEIHTAPLYIDIR